MSNIKNKKSIASLIVFVIGIIAVLYYIVVAQKVEFDSDFTDTVIWAEAMLTGNGLFDTTMNYAYTLPFGGSLLMAPFVAILGVGYKAHALGFILFLAIFVFSLYKMLRGMDFSANESMTASGVILLLSLATKNTRMIMWGHVIHYSLGLLFVMIAMALYSKVSMLSLSFGKLGARISSRSGVEALDSNPDCKNSKGARTRVIVLAVLTALFCTNGLTTILFFAIPFYGALIIERFISVDDDLFCRENINSLIISVICMFSGLVGFVISKVLQRGVTTVYEGIFKKITSWQSWVWDIEDRLRCFLVCTAGQIDSEVAMESFSGIRIMFMAFYGFVILFVPFIAIISYKKMKNRTIRMYFIAYYILLFSTLFIYDFSSARGTAHRIVGLYMTAMMCSVIYMVWLIKNKKLSRFGYAIALVFVVATLFCCYSVASLRGQNRFERLAQVLKDNNLRYGYAEYWSAQVTSVLSDGKVWVYPITVSEAGEINPRMYNVRTWEFDAREGVDRYFAFLSSWEYETVKNTIGDDAIEVIPFDDDGYILVFDHNIF